MSVLVLGDRRPKADRGSSVSFIYRQLPWFENCRSSVQTTQSFGVSGGGSKTCTPQQSFVLGSRNSPTSPPS